MRTQLQRMALLGLAAGLLSGCVEPRPPLYRWGAYEGLIYDMYANPGTADPTTQIVKLTEDIQITQSKGQRVPPGVHAHLGYMYSLTGNAELARAELETERRLFPESATFVDGMLKRLSGEG